MSATLSLVLPNFNHGAFIDRALDAVLSQSRVPDEIIVIDDCSTDDSVSVVESFVRKYSNVQLVRNDKNQGCMACNNLGRRIATGDYVVGLSADDLPLPGLYEKSMSLLEEYPEAAWCSADIELWFGKREFKIVHGSNWSPNYGYIDEEEFSRALFLGPLHTHTVVARRDLFWQYGGFDDRLSYQADWYLYLAMGFRHGVCYLPKPLGVWRFDESSWSNDGMIRFDNQAKIIGELLERLSGKDMDVAPLFAKSGVMRLFMYHVRRYMETFPERITPFFLQLFHHAIEEDTKSRNSNLLQDALRLKDQAKLYAKDGDRVMAAKEMAKAVCLRSDPRSLIALNELLHSMVENGYS